MTYTYESDTEQARATSRLEIVWALVMLQGGILTLSVLESLVINIGSAFLVGGTLVLTIAAALVTFLAARGLRRRRRWARRLTLIAEWLLVVVTGLEMVATMVLAGTSPDLVPVVTGVAVPVTVLLLLRSTKPQFAAEAEEHDLDAPADDPILGTLV